MNHMLKYPIGVMLPTNSLDLSDVISALTAVNLL